MTSPPQVVRCPRCGYNQRGAVSTWSSFCPLQGTCTECGLEFNWSEVLRPEKFEPRWCIEFEPKWRRLFIAGVKTLWRSLWPWGFWSRLKMSDSIRWGRLAVYVLLLFLPAGLVYVIGQASLATYVRAQIEAQLQASAPSRPQHMASIQTMVQQYRAMLPTGDASQDQQINATIIGLNAELARLQALGMAVETIDRSWLATTWEAVVTPLSRVSSANILDPTGARSWPYPSPQSLWAVFNRNRGMSQFAYSDLGLSMAWLAWGIAMTVLLPLSFACMPMSMRKARVRWAHIIRVMAYSIWIPLAFCWMTVLVLGPAYFFDHEITLAAARTAIPYVPWAAVALWWVAATGRYLKIPHSLLTIGLLTLMCLLISLALTALYDQRLAWEMLDLFDALIR